MKEKVRMEYADILNGLDSTEYISSFIAHRIETSEIDLDIDFKNADKKRIRTKIKELFGQ